MARRTSRRRRLYPGSPRTSQSGRTPISTRRDFESGFDYFGARFYWPDLGRFTTSDPAGLLAENLYTYVMNDPLMFIDPTGMQGVQTGPTFRVEIIGDPSKLRRDAQFAEFWNGFLLQPPETPLGIQDRPGARGDAANNGTPQQPTKTQERIERLQNCALGYYGIDPLSISGATSNGAKWGLVALSAGGIPKSAAKQMGLRVIMQPGASEYTSALSMLSLATGGGGALRTVANFGSKWAGPIAIASVGIDATAIGVCTAWE